MRFEVWAPEAERVELQLDGVSHAMTPVKRGRWSAEVPAEAGARYGFMVDGQGPFPDPRSDSQPEGVHGLSEIVDHTAFPWKVDAWEVPASDSWVIYELHIGTFTPEGTLDAAIGKLDHLVSLGVTAVELMPVNSFPGGRGWGYDGVSLFAPQHGYGGPEALKRFVDACHERGLATVLDVVYNHLGPSGNYLSRYGPYFTDKYATPWGDAVNFDDSGSDEVRRFVIDNAQHWIERYRFDGLRIDAVHAILDRSPQHILEEMSQEVEALGARLGRPVRLIAESDLADPRVITPRAEGGWGMDAQWNDDLHHAIHAYLTGERSGYYADFGDLDHIVKALRNGWVYDGDYSSYRDRRHGRAHGGVPAHRFLGYIQTHDQVGNRARGERLGHLVAPEIARVAAALYLTAPFIPMLFMGEEWNASTPFQYFTDHEDPDLGRAVSQGRRNEFKSFGWSPGEVPDPQDRATFERSKLDWAELDEQPHADMLDLYRRLIRLRLSEPDLLNDDLERIEVSNGDGWLTMRRGSIVTACNFSETEIEVPVTGDILLATDKDPMLGPDGTTMAPRSAVVLRTEPGSR